MLQERSLDKRMDVCVPLRAGNRKASGSPCVRLCLCGYVGIHVLPTHCQPQSTTHSTSSLARTVRRTGRQGDRGITFLECSPYASPYVHILIPGPSEHATFHAKRDSNKLRTSRWQDEPGLSSRAPCNHHRPGGGQEGPGQPLRCWPSGRGRGPGDTGCRPVMQGCRQCLGVGRDKETDSPPGSPEKPSLSTPGFPKETPSNL